MRRILVLSLLAALPAAAQQQGGPPAFPPFKVDQVKVDNAIVAVENAVNTGAAGDIATAAFVSADALLCVKNLYDSTKAAFEAVSPPTPNPVCQYGGTYPNCNPPPAGGGGGTSPLIYIFGGIVALGVIGGVVYVATKKS